MNSSGILSSQPWRSFHSDWRNIFALTTYGATKPMGSKIEAVRLITFLLVSASSLGLILKMKVSFWTSQVTPRALSVGSVSPSTILRTDCARSFSGTNLRNSLSFDIHFVKLNPPSESNFTSPACRLHASNKDGTDLNRSST